MQTKYKNKTFPKTYTFEIYKIHYIFEKKKEKQEKKEKKEKDQSNVIFG